MDKKNGRKISFASRRRWAIFFLVFLAVAWCGRSPARAASTQEAVSFTDLQNHWARSHITRLATLEVVKGYPDHTFKPDQLVNRLETLVLVVRSGGFTTEAERRTSGSGKTGKASSTGGTATNRSGASAAPTPRVPWGQPYVDLAVEKGFLPLGKPDDFDFAGPATRLEVARLLARALYLVPPASGPGSAPAGKEVSAGTGFATGKAFSDEELVPPIDQIFIRAVAGAGVMSGYPDGTFRPLDSLTRAEMAIILSRLVDQGWVKTAAGRRLTGWISGIGTGARGGRQELEFTSLDGVQKLQVAEGFRCYRAEKEWPLERAANFRCEVILDGRKQVSWVNLLEQKDGTASSDKIRGSVKSVVLGKDNLLVLNDLNCEDQILPLAWDAVVSGKNAKQGFKTLKPGVFVDVELSRGQVMKVTVLEVKNVSGTVDRFDSRRLYLKEEASGNKPGWFNYWDRARVVDKDGVRKGSALAGNKVQITYLDPFPGEIDDEIALEIKVTG